MDQPTPPPIANQDIASYEVSEDGVTWRPYDPKIDGGLRLHRRICFAAAEEDAAEQTGHAT